MSAFLSPLRRNDPRGYSKQVAREQLQQTQQSEMESEQIAAAASAAAPASAGASAAEPTVAKVAPVVSNGDAAVDHHEDSVDGKKKKKTEVGDKHKSSKSLAQERRESTKKRSK